jgi:hypothetical protein
VGRRHTDDAAIGGDCFLDTIANLVGILIILVVIVGARSYSTAKQSIEKELLGQTEALQSPLKKVQQLDQDLDSQHISLVNYERELAYRSAERMATIDEVTIAKAVLEEEVGKLDDDQKKQFEVDVELSELEKQLAELLKQQGELPIEAAQVSILQHLPTPMAKTVFGQEIHVMLLDGMVTVVPWNDLIETLKREARGAAARNSQKSNITNTLGPIGGFTMKYALKSQTGVMSDGVSARMGRMVELDRFILLPTEDAIKETLDQAMGSGGRLSTELSRFRNQYVTVTAWVYPDSFQTFRMLKERLFPEGFLCAARPLPFDVPIGASPNGANSTAQ